MNALNQEYQNQQQRASTEQQQRFNQQQQIGDINQLAPGGRQPGFGPLGVGVHSPVNQVPDRDFGSANRVFDRGYIVNDLRQQGFAADDWRVVNQNGRWWFWTPDNSWLYYNNDGWVAYRGNLSTMEMAARRNVTVPAGYPAEDWRLVEHDGRWWFWTPDRTWMYFNEGRWNDYPVGDNVAVRGKSDTHYGVGYRGNSDRVVAIGRRGNASAKCIRRIHRPTL